MSLSNKDIGLLGETIALYYLKSRGYEILERNYRTEFGEIDIIAKIDSVLVFCEAKLRAGIAFGHADEQLGKKQQRNILLSADKYITDNVILDKDIRMDYIAMQLFRGEFKLRHIKDAFNSDALE